jgi:hypothetical protein
MSSILPILFIEALSPLFLLLLKALSPALAGRRSVNTPLDWSAIRHHSPILPTFRWIAAVSDLVLVTSSSITASWAGT